MLPASHLLTNIIIYYDIEGQQEGVATCEILSKEQKACRRLAECWRFAVKKKGNFFGENGLVYHYETAFVHRIKQLVLPECRRNIGTKFAHDARRGDLPITWLGKEPDIVPVLRSLDQR